MKTIGVALILCLAAGNVGASEEANKEAVRRYYEVGINQARAEISHELLTADFVKVTNGSEASIVGPEALRRAVDSHVDNNSEYGFQIHELIAEGRSVVARWQWESVNTKYGEPRPVLIHGIAIFTLRDGRISRLWQVFDMKSFNEQVGAE